MGCGGFPSESVGPMHNLVRINHVGWPVCYMEQGQGRITLAVGKMIPPLVKCSIFQSSASSKLYVSYIVDYISITCHLLQGSESKKIMDKVNGIN